MLRYKNGRLFFRIRKDLLLALFAAVFLFWRPSDISSEMIRMTSYYPAPYGGYDMLFTTGNTFLAHQDGNVYWGPDEASYLSKANGGAIILGGTGRYDSPGIGITSGGGRYSSAIGIGYIGREAVLTVASGREQQGVSNQGGDLYIGGFMRRMCQIKDTRYGSRTYCGGSATASTKWIVLPAVRPFKFSGNTEPPPNQNEEDDGRSLAELEAQLEDLKNQKNQLMLLIERIRVCEMSYVENQCKLQKICDEHPPSPWTSNPSIPDPTRLESCSALKSRYQSDLDKINAAIKEMEAEIAKLKQEAAKPKPKPTQQQDNHGLDKMLCCRFELVS